MSAKTPQFEVAMNAYFKKLSPGMRTCSETGEENELTANAILRYRTLRVPVPTIAPWARIQRLRASAGGFDFFQRTSPMGRAMITVYDSQSPVSLLPAKEWYEARLNGLFLNHAQAVDVDRSFFEQWKTLSLTVPRPALVSNPKNEKSEWTCYCNDAKNEYYCYSESSSHDMLYCEHSWLGAYCVDCTAADRNEWCYETVLGQESAYLIFSEYCVTSHHLIFCRSCTSCSDCFGCVNLRQKKFCFMNEQLTEEEYRKRMAEIDLKDAKVFASWKEKVRKEIWQKFPQRASGNRQCEDCDGDDMVSCRETTGTSVAECERCENVFFNAALKDSTDCTMCVGSELCAYSQEISQGYLNRFSAYCANCVDIEYCEFMESCQNCFGCIGLEKKKFCIFNKQYTEEAYWTIVDELKTKMLERGEYGEFFPYELHLTAYNTSHAPGLFPLSEEEARKKGARWYDFGDEKKPGTAVLEQPPTHLDQASDEATKKMYACSVSGRPFRLVKDELEFYRKFDIAPPQVHPTVRRNLRMQRIPPLKYLPVNCTRCGIQTKTRLTEGMYNELFCDTCYQEYVANDEALIHSVA